MWQRVFSWFVFSAFSLAAQQYRAFWADAFHDGFKTPAQVDRMVDDLASAKANAVFVEVRNRGGSYYLHSLEPPMEDPGYALDFDALQYLIGKAHARGIEVHAWFPVFPLAPASDPRHLWNLHGPGAEGDRMWMTAGAGGKLSTSLDPGHPDVLQYLADVILYPAAYYDLDGLHLDYIRYPEGDSYGWNPAAIARFQRLYHTTGMPDARDPQWADFRRKQVTDLVRQIYLRAFEIRPALKISAALITWGNGPASEAEYRAKDAYSFVFQDWLGWLREGILDIGIPMNYFDDSRLGSYFDRWIEFEKDHQYNRGMVIGPAAYLNSIPNTISQLNRAMSPSAAGNTALGVDFYSYASTNMLDAAGAPVAANAEFYRMIGDIFGSQMAVPVLPWKANPANGHVLGVLRLDSGPDWWKDGAAIFIESVTGGVSLQTSTNSSGFFGAVDLAPDLYRVRLERDGAELYRSDVQEVRAGSAARFDIHLPALQ